MAAKKNVRRTGQQASPASLKGLRGERSSALTPELDRLIHERLRLGILSSLAVNASLTFSDLKVLLKTSDGNLSVHARKLEEAGYLSCSKSFQERVPRTEYRLTAGGRKALQRYLAHMEGLIAAMKSK